MIEPAFHERGPLYVRWAAAMAVGLQTGVPWVMCKQDDAPDPVVSLVSFHFHALAKFVRQFGMLCCCIRSVLF